MNCLIVSATIAEISPFLGYLETTYTSKQGSFYKNEQQIQILITGIGLPKTALRLSHFLSRERPDFVLQVGIAGSFDAAVEIGKVVEIITERYADLGAETASSGFLDLAEMGLIAKEQLVLYNKNPFSTLNLPQKNGISVNKVQGSAASIAHSRARFSPDTESMEGAAFFETCLFYGIPFAQVRAISNYVEPRNRENWNIPLAIKNLNEWLIDWVVG